MKIEMKPEFPVVNKNTNFATIRSATKIAKNSHNNLQKKSKKKQNNSHMYPFTDRPSSTEVIKIYFKISSFFYNFLPIFFQ